MFKYPYLHMFLCVLAHGCIIMAMEARVVLTPRAWKRVNECFNVRNAETARKVLAEAAREGSISTEGEDVLIEHGCVLMAGVSNGNGVLEVDTVYNLCNGIPGELKERTREARPTLWEDCEVTLPEEGSEGYREFC